MNTKLTKQYRATVTVNEPNCELTATGNNLADVQNVVSTLLKGRSRFEASPGNTVLVFSDTHFEGKQPIGWIAEYEVPQSMSIRSLTEDRFARAA